MANYDEQDGVDGVDALQKAVAYLQRYPHNQEDLKFYFQQVEVKMLSCGVKKNFTKLQVMSTILPEHVINAVKPILRKQENEFPDKDGYKKLKNEVF